MLGRGPTLAVIYLYLYLAAAIGAAIVTHSFRAPRITHADNDLPGTSKRSRGGVGWGGGLCTVSMHRIDGHIITFGGNKNKSSRGCASP